MVLPDEREAEIAGRRLRRRWVEDEEAGAAERKAAAVAVAVAAVVGDIMALARSRCFAYLILGWRWEFGFGCDGGQNGGPTTDERLAVCSFSSFLFTTRIKFI